jgi:hypothetical protein
MLSLACVSAAAALGAVWRAGVVLGEGPVLIVVQKQELGAALEAAPWFDPFPGQAGSGEGEVWLLSRPECPRCRAVESRLQARGVDVRLVLAAPRGAAPAEEAVAAELARRRDGFVFQEWLRDPAAPPPQPAGVSPADEGAQAQAGYAEYARAAVERVGRIAAANGVEPAAPMLIWRRGVEWRLAPQASAADLAFLQRDLAAAQR